jgi:hypothetical protein
LGHFLYSNDILHALDIAREDRYLEFLNVEADAILAALPNNNKKHDPSKAELLMKDLVSNHSMRLFQLTTLWSAYILLHHVEKELSTKDTLNDVQKLEKIQTLCNDYYEVDYQHLTGEESLLVNDDEEEEVEKSSQKYTKKQKKNDTVTVEAKQEEEEDRVEENEVEENEVEEDQ